MRLKFFLLLFFLTSFITSSAYAQSAQDKLSAYLQSFTTLQANFSQHIENGAGMVLQESSGTTHLKRPGLFRWETTTPNQQLIVADGKYIWIYDKDLEQITRQNQHASNNSPGLLLSDSVSKLVSRFNIIAKNNNTFKLIPKGKKDLFQSVELVFDNQQLSQMLLYDNLGQMTKITFSNVKVNPNFDNSVFKFKPPANIDVITQ